MKTLSDKKINIPYDAALFLIPAIYSIFQNQIFVGALFFFLSLVMAGVSIEQSRRTIFEKISDSTLVHFKNALIWIMWIGMCLATLSIDNFGWAVERPEWLKSPQVWLMFVFFIGLLGAIKMADSQEKAVADTSKMAARVWFWIILVLAVVMLAYKMHNPEGSYGFDEAEGIKETRSVRDLQDYRQGYYIAIYQKPIYCYLTLFLWHWLPNATDIFITRLASMVTILATVWLLYLTGKELGGRRTGIMAAAIGAVSKPALNIASMASGVVMVPFFILLPLLFALRLFKKPSLKHFLQLGFCLALGIYNNDYVRIEVIFFAVCIFFWLLSKKENRKLTGPMGWLVLFNAVVIFFYTIYMCFGFIPSWGFNRFFAEHRGLCFNVMFFTALSLAVLRVVLGPESEGVKKNNDWINAILGFWVCILLDYPMITDSFDRLNGMVDRSKGLWASMVNFIQNFNNAIHILFCWGTSPANMGILGDALFSFGEDAVIFLGLAFFFVKPTWQKSFVFMVAVVGILPHVIVGATHNARLVDTIGPFILLAALGLNSLFTKTANLFRRRWVNYAVLTLFIAFWGWSAWTTYSRVYLQWFDQQILYLTGARNIAVQDAAKGNRIYICEDLVTDEFMILSEGLSILYCTPVNVIYVEPGEKPRDITLIARDFSFGAGKALQTAVKKNFPQITWARKGEVEYCTLPYALLADKKQKMFVFKNEPKDVWKREYILNECGLFFGYVDHVDRAAKIDAPVEPSYMKTYNNFLHQWLLAVRYSATIHVAKDADYIIHYKAINRSWLKIDGKMLVDLSFFKLVDSTYSPIYWAPAKEGDVKVHLDKGDHRVEAVTSFQRTTTPPEFWVRPEGATAPGTSLWSSFNF